MFYIYIYFHLRFPSPVIGHVTNWLIFVSIHLFLFIYHLTHLFIFSPSFSPVSFLLLLLLRGLSFSPYLVVIALPLSSRHFIAVGWVDFAPLHWPNYFPWSVVYHARYTCFPLFVLSENGGPSGATMLNFGSAFQIGCLSKRSRRVKVL